MNKGQCIDCGKPFEYVMFKDTQGLFHLHHYSYFNKSMFNNIVPLEQTLDKVLNVFKAIDNQLIGMYCWNCAKKAASKCEFLAKFYASANQEVNCIHCNTTKFYLRKYSTTITTGLSNIQQDMKRKQEDKWKYATGQG
jgi:hypothetical protein